MPGALAADGGGAGAGADQIGYAYAAGLIDGEGCIRIARSRVVPTNENRSVCYSIELQIRMTDRSPLDYLQELFGLGHIYATASSKPQWKDTYVWMCKSGQVTKVLRLVRPYLIIKARQADLALEFDGRLRVVGFKSRVPEALITQRDRLYQQMRRLNARGKEGQMILQGSSA